MKCVSYSYYWRTFINKNVFVLMYAYEDIHPFDGLFSGTTWGKPTAERLNQSGFQLSKR